MAALIKYNPWSMLRDIQDEVNHLFNQNLTEKGVPKWCPQVDIIENKDKYSIIADLPGVDPNQIKVSLENNILTLKGERKSETREEKGGFSKLERFSGSFCRQFSLPENVQVNNIEAKNRKNGVIEIIIPKAATSLPQQIEIKVEE